MAKFVPVICEGKEFPTVAAMCAHYGVERFKTHSRIQRGWTPEEAVELVARKESAYRPKPVKINGICYPNLTVAAQTLGVNLGTVKARMEDGYSPEDAFLGNLKPRIGTRGKPLSFQGKNYPSRAMLATDFGLSGTLVSKRLKSGWSLEQALEVEPAPPRFRNFEGHAREQKWKEVRQVGGKTEPVPDADGYKLYLVTNTINSKVYVGITIAPIEARLKQHFATARRGRKSAFSNAINKHGPEVFRIELLNDSAKTYDELQNQEVREIVKRDSIRNGYNTAMGGAIGTSKKLRVAGRVFQSYLEAAAYYNVDPTVMSIRLGRLKWSPEQSVGIEPREKYGRKKVIVGGKEYPSLKNAAEAHGMDYQLVWDRLAAKKWTLEQALQLEDVPDSSKYAGVAVSVFGLTFRSYCECAKYYGIKAPSLLKRLADKQGSIDEAIRHLQTKPKGGGKPKPVSAFGVNYPSIAALASQLGLKVKSIRNRMAMTGQSLEKAITRLQSNALRRRSAR